MDTINLSHCNDIIDDEIISRIQTNVMKLLAKQGEICCNEITFSTPPALSIDQKTERLFLQFALQDLSNSYVSDLLYRLQYEFETRYNTDQNLEEELIEEDFDDPSILDNDALSDTLWYGTNFEFESWIVNAREKYDFLECMKTDDVYPFFKYLKRVIDGVRTRKDYTRTYLIFTFSIFKSYCESIYPNLSRSNNQDFLNLLNSLEGKKPERFDNSLAKSIFTTGKIRSWSNSKESRNSSAIYLTRRCYMRLISDFKQALHGETTNRSEQVESKNDLLDFIIYKYTTFKREH